MEVVSLRQASHIYAEHSKALSTITERFWSRVNKTDGCWNWTGALYKNSNYGQFYVGGKLPNGRYRCARAPKFSWEMHFGLVPKGLWVLHKCDNPACVRPDHLFLGTASDNAIDRDRKGRGKNSRKTHCPQGHAYSPENTYIYLGHIRMCKTCMRNRQKRQEVA